MLLLVKSVLTLLGCFYSAWGVDDQG